MRETEDILEQVVAERQRQINKGYTLVHDDAHHVSEFALFIRERANHPCRKNFIEIAALAVAAVEKIDRSS